MSNLQQVEEKLQNLKVKTEPVFDDRYEQLENYQLIRRESDEQPLCIVSDKYQLYQHIDAFHDTIEKIEKLGLNAELKSLKTNVDERHNSIHATWTFPEISFNIDGSKTEASLEMLNSTDGLMGFREMLGLYRLKCSNGLIIGDDIFKSYRRHYGEGFDDDIDNIDQFKSAIESYEEIKEAVARSRTMKAGKDFIQGLIDTGFPVKIVKDNFKKIFYQYTEDYNEFIQNYRTVWAYYAVLTNWLSHEVAETNFRREVRLSKNLSNLMLKQ